MGHMPGAPVWLVLGGTNYWAEAGGRAREAGRGQRATVWNPELGPLFCHRADGGLEGWGCLDRTSLEAGEELAALGPSLVRLGRCHH